MEIHTKDTAYSVVVFEDGELQLDVALNPRENTVWLNRQQFGKHINSIFKEKLENIQLS